MFKWDRRTATLSLMAVGYFMCYLDRMVMSTAIPYIGQDFNLSKTAMGGVMSAFFIGYALVQIPGGILSDRFGSRRVMAFTVTAWSIFTTLTGAVSNLSQMIVVRLLLGLGEGPYISAVNKGIASWFEQSRRGVATSIIMASMSVALAVAPLFAVWVMSMWGWRGIFYSLLIPGVILAALIAAFVTDGPQLKSAANASPPRSADAKTTEVQYSFWDILKDPFIWKSTIMFFCFSITAWAFKTWLPAYLVTSRNMKMGSMGIAVSITFIAGIAGSLFGGWLSDKQFSDNRRIPVFICQACTGVLLYLMSTVESMELLMIFQTCAGFFVTASIAAIWSLLVSHVSKKKTGRATGVLNTGGQLAGLVAPIMVGYLADLSGGSFDTAFKVLIACVVVSLGALSACKPTNDDLDKVVGAA